MAQLSNVPAKIPCRPSPDKEPSRRTFLHNPLCFTLYPGMTTTTSGADSTIPTDFDVPQPHPDDIARTSISRRASSLRVQSSAGNTTLSPSDFLKTGRRFTGSCLPGSKKHTRRKPYPGARGYGFGLPPNLFTARAWGFLRSGAPPSPVFHVHVRHALQRPSPSGQRFCVCRIVFFASSHAMVFLRGRG